MASFYLITVELDKIWINGLDVNNVVQ
jgi:hypothetical protein